MLRVLDDYTYWIEDPAMNAIDHEFTPLFYVTIKLPQPLYTYQNNAGIHVHDRDGEYRTTWQWPEEDCGATGG
jgi:hypothetical protein